MGIRTELSRNELESVARDWGLGTLENFRGLPEGSVNTLYVLETGSGRFVLRLSEGRVREEIEFETALLSFLESVRFPAVRLVPRSGGEVFGVVRERFACVFRWAPGERGRSSTYTPERAMDSGRELARLHSLTDAFTKSLPNRYAPPVIRSWVAELSEEGRDANRPDDPELWEALPLLEREAEALTHLPQAPLGVIHADWFLDNLHFVGDRLACVLDFEMACRGPHVLDLAIALHASSWRNGDFDPALVKALMAGYRSEREIGTDELEAFHAWARFAALRFTISRIRDFHRSELSDGELVKKDWRRFRDRLRRTVDLGPEGWLRLVGVG